MSALTSKELRDIREQLVIYQFPAIDGRTWVNAWHSIRNSEAIFPSRSRVTIHVNPPSPFEQQQCFYNDYEDYILLNHRPGGDFNCIWGYFGLFVLPHEYGHALHELRLGGVAPIDQSCVEHRPDTFEGFGCAYNEGFADWYYNAIGQPTPFAGHFPVHPHYTSDTLEVNGHSAPGRDGAHFSGMISAFFYDLVDPIGEDRDSLSLAVTDVTTVMGDCMVLEYYSDINPTGIDHLIWCLEAQVDSEVTEGDDYFQSRSVHPSSQNQSDHYWNESHVRSLWLKNLYNESG